MVEPPRSRVLIVDEDAAFSGTLQRMLGKLYDAFVLNNAQSVIAAIDAGERIDAIVCGLTMTLRLYRVLKTTHPHHAARMIFLTSAAQAQEDRAYLAGLPNKRLSKPFEIAELKQLIKSQLAAGHSPATHHR